MKDFVNPWESQNPWQQGGAYHNLALDVPTGGEDKESIHNFEGNVFFSMDGYLIGFDGLSGQNVYIVGNTMEKIGRNAKIPRFGMWKKAADNPLATPALINGNGEPYLDVVYKMPLNYVMFNELAGTLYNEGSNVWQESAAIYGILNNRAVIKGKTPYLIASSSLEGIYGWAKRADINDPHADGTRITNAFRGLIEAVITRTDFSNGAYFWHGVDFGISSWKANKDYYQVGFRFAERQHDLWNLGDKEVSEPWHFKFESTAAFGKTTFMRLTNRWREEHGNADEFGS